MNKLRLLISSLALLLFCSFLKPLNEWIKFENNNCKILFPGTPANDSTLTDTKVGKLTLYTHLFEVPENSKDSCLLYGLIETQYPAQFFDTTGNKSFMKGFFEGAVNGAVSNVAGRLISQKDISKNGYPGKEIKIDFQNGTAIITMNIFLAKTRLFAIQTISLPGKENNTGAVKFNNSFEIK